MAASVAEDGVAQKRAETYDTVAGLQDNEGRQDEAVDIFQTLCRQELTFASSSSRSLAAAAS